jgi:glycosyltransferase involved in cell wall biosynthesis
MSASRNLGVRHARGEFAAFLDGDDWWFPDKLDRQIELFAANPRAVMVCGGTEYWHSWQAGADVADRRVLVGQWSRRDGRPGETLEQDRLYEPRELLRRLYLLGKGATPSMSGNMFRRNIALNFGGFDESFRGLFEDQVFRAKIYLHGPVFVSHQIFDRYRQHDESCFQVAQVTGESERARYKFLLWLTNYLDEIGCRDRDVRWKVHRKMLRYRFPILSRAWSGCSNTARRVVRKWLPRRPGA